MAQTNSVHASQRVVALPGATTLNAEHALRFAIDSQVFAAMHELASLPGGRAVQAVYVGLLRRLPNVRPDRKRLAIDTGHSESSVKRAIGLLERIGVIEVERRSGKRSEYRVADLRYSEISSRCHSSIRTLLRKERQSRTTCDPTQREGRVRTGPATRVTCDPGVGSLVTHKETKKKTSKQQGAAADENMSGKPADGNRRLAETALKRHGLSDAAYLVDPRHPKAIPELVDAGDQVADLIDAAMKRASWSPGAGTGARVEYLRKHASETAEVLQKRNLHRKAAARNAAERAQAVADGLKVPQRMPSVPCDENTRLTLVEEALAELGESAEVVNEVRRDELACEKLYRRAQYRRTLTQKVEASSDSEFDELTRRLFEAKPQLRHVLGSATRKSTALCSMLVEMLEQHAAEEPKPKLRKVICTGVASLTATS